METGLMFEDGDTDTRDIRDTYIRLDEGGEGTRILIERNRSRFFPEKTNLIAAIGVYLQEMRNRDNRLEDQIDTLR